MFRWRKLGLVFGPRNAEGRPWLRGYAQAPATLLFDDFVRVYFSCRPDPDEQGQYVSYSAWADLDRRDPTRVLRVAERPVLALGQPGMFDEFGVYPFSVLRDGDRVLGYYGGWTRCESVPFNVAIGLATSRDDGMTFERAGPGPVLSYAPDEPFVISGPKIRRFAGALHLWYIAGRRWKLVQDRPEPVYRIRSATSADGVHWTRAGRDLVAPRIEEDEAQASPDVIRLGDRYHMFFCYRHSEGFRSKARGYRIGYAWSGDLREWHRDDALAGLNVSDDGWDSEMVAYPHVFELDGQVYMAYLGNAVGREGFGLAVLEGMP